MNASSFQVPPHSWDMLSSEEQGEFAKLYAGFHQKQRISSKDRRSATFHGELEQVLRFVEHGTTFKEHRCIVAGICFAGPYVCINTRLLKNLLGRCKSSINGIFQQLGYSTLRTKSKARLCVVGCMPSLGVQQDFVRQWAVRLASEDAHYCFVSSSSWADFPPITADDLIDDHAAPKPRTMHFAPMPPLKPHVLAFDLPSREELYAFEPWPASFAMDDLEPMADVKDHFSFDDHSEFDMSRSESLQTPLHDWEKDDFGFGLCL
jgi:hypothetical protein